MPFLGTIAGRIKIDVAQAVAAYAAVRAANARTLYALRGSSTAFQTAGKGMAVAGGLMVAAFAKAVGAAAEFEKTLDFFGAVTNSTSEQMEKVSDKALQLGQDTIYSAGQIAESFVELGKAGVSAEQVIGGVGDAVAHLGASADIPLTTAADIITAAVQTFDLGGDAAVRVADLLQGAANASIVEVQDLGVSLKYAGGIAAAVSIPIESLIDALSLLGKAGIKGSTAGTSLRQIMVSLTGTSDKARGVMRDLGIITKDGTNLFYTQTGAIKPLADVFQILHDKTKNLTEAQRLAAFKIIFNNRALAAANILTRKGAAGFAEMNEEIGKTTAADVSAKRLDNLAGDIEILRGNIETLFIKGGTPFQNFFRTVVQGITKVVQAFGNLPEGVQTAIFAFLGFGGAALLVAGAFSMIVGTFLNFIHTIKLLGSAFTFIRGAITAVIAGMRLLGLAFLTNPIGIIITAIGLLIVGFILLYQNSETFRNIIGAIGRFFVRVWEGVIAFFSDIPGFFRDLWENIKGWFQTGIDWIKDNWQKLIVIFGGPLVWIVALVVNFKDQIIGFFKNIWDKVVEFVGNMVENVVNFFKELPKKILYWMGWLVGKYVGFWLTIYKKVGEILLQLVTTVIDFFKELPGKIIAFNRMIWENIVAIFTRIKDWLFEAVPNMIEGVINWFKELPVRIVVFLYELRDKAVEAFNVLRTRGIELAKQVVVGIINFLRTLPQRAVQFFIQMKDRAISALITLWNRAKEWAGKIKDGFINTIRNLPGLVAGVFRDILGTIGGFVSDLWSKAAEAGSALWNGFKEGIGMHSPSYLEKAAYQINDTLNDEVPKMKKAVERIQTLSRVTNEQKLPQVATNTVSSAAAAMAAQAVQLQRANTRAGVGVKQSISTSQTQFSDVDMAKLATVITPPMATATVEKNWNIEVNNPVPEEPSKSVTKAMQLVTYLGMDDDD